MIEGGVNVTTDRLRLALRRLIAAARRPARALAAALFAALLLIEIIAAGSTAPLALAAEAVPVRVGLLAETTVPVGNPFHLYGAGGATLWNYAASGGWFLPLAGPLGPRGDLLPVAASTLVAQRHMKVEPDPATGTEYVTAVVPLRRDLFWSDGSRLDAADVAFTYETLARLDVARLGGNWPSLFPQGLLARVEALDRHTVKFWFHRLPGLGEWQHGLLAVPILHKASWEPLVQAAFAAPAPEKTLAALQPEAVVLLGPSLPAPGVPSDKPLRAAGPNPRDTRAHEKAILFASGGAALSNPLTRFEYRTGRVGGEVAQTLEQPPVPLHTFDVVASRAEAVRALATGQIDAWLDPLSAAPAPDFLGMRVLGFNTAQPVTGQLLLRRAIAIGIDRDAIAQAVAPEYSVRPAHSLVPAEHALWHNPALAAWDEAARPDRLARARESLAAVWLLPQRPLVIATVEAAYDPVAYAAAMHVAALLDTLGLPATVVAEPFEAFRTRVFVKGEFDLFVAGWRLGSGAFPHQLAQLVRRAAPDLPAGWGVTGYRSAEYERLVRQMLQATDAQSARRAALRLQELAHRDAVLVPLVTVTPMQMGAAASSGPAQSAADLGWLWPALVPRPSAVWLE